MRREFVALAVGLCLVGCAALFPPRKHAGEHSTRAAPRGFLLSPSLYVDEGERGKRGSGYFEAWHYEYVLDLPRLLCEGVAIAGLTASAFFTLRPWAARPPVSRGAADAESNISPP